MLGNIFKIFNERVFVVVFVWMIFDSFWSNLGMIGFKDIVDKWMVIKFKIKNFRFDNFVVGICKY